MNDRLPKTPNPDGRKRLSKRNTTRVASSAPDLAGPGNKRRRRYDSGRGKGDLPQPSNGGRQVTEVDGDWHDF